MSFMSNAVGSSRVSGAEARRLVREEDALLVDVRSPQEFAGGHAEGALNIPLRELSARRGEIPSGRKIIVYCLSGARSASAASVLRGHGHEVLDAGGLSNMMS